MKEIKDLISQRPEQMFTPDNSENYVDKENYTKISEVLVRLGNIYGHMFTSNHKTDELFEEVAREWAISIGHYSCSRLNRTIEKCKSEHKKTVSLPEFIACSTVSQYEAMLGRSDPLRLSKLETHEEKSGRIKRGKIALNKIRESMKLTKPANVKSS